MSDIETTIYNMDNGVNVGRAATGIMALIVPIRSELKTAQKITLFVRQELMKLLIQYDMEQYQAEMKCLGKAIGHDAVCYRSNTSKFCTQTKL